MLSSQRTLQLLQSLIWLLADVTAIIRSPSVTSVMANGLVNVGYSVFNPIGSQKETQ